MSDLSRLRRQLQLIEAAGKRHKAELAALKEEIETQDGGPTRGQENRALWLENLIASDRRDWTIAWRKVRAEEQRLIEDPAAMLKFS